jgi:DNA transposition AAA+ family ATPase
MTKITALNTFGSDTADYSRTLDKIINQYQFSQSQLASKIGISESVISQVRSGEYEYNPNNYVWIQIIKFIENINKKVYETKLLRVVYRMLNDAFKDKEIAVITSCSGAGKTTAIVQYCLINHYAVHIRVNEVFTTKYLLQIILRSLGSPYLGLNTQQMYETCSEILARKNRLIVIDEAERLKVSQLELLRDLYDQGNMGLCLVGLDSLRSLLQRGKNLRENLVQLYSRVAYQKIVDILEPEDVEMIINDKIGKHMITKPMMKELSKRYKSRGGLRAVIKLSNLAIKLADKNNVKIINDDFINACTGELSL